MITILDDPLEEPSLRQQTYIDDFDAADLLDDMRGTGVADSAETRLDVRRELTAYLPQRINAQCRVVRHLDNIITSIII